VSVRRVDLLDAGVAMVGGMEVRPPQGDSWVGEHRCVLAAPFFWFADTQCGNAENYRECNKEF
jgi:hypothetical protein